MKIVLGFLFDLVLLGTRRALAVDIMPGIPGTNQTQGHPTAIVGNFYQFALAIGGLLAFGAIVYGGIRYALAVGNPSGQSDARAWITQALLGLLLLVGAVLVLNVINPALGTPSLPGLQKLESVKPPVPGLCDQCNFVDPNKPSCGSANLAPCNKPLREAGCQFTQVTPTGRKMSCT